MKHIVITGASSGIGKATAHQLLQKGYRVSLLSRSIESMIAEFSMENAQCIACDVRDYDAVNQAFAKCRASFGPIDVLVNNAGLGIFDRLTDGSIEDWHTMVDTNVKGVLNTIHAALPELRSRKGHVINLASVAAHHVFPNSGVYCSTKWAVAALSESIRIELAKEVRVTTISPGAVNTAFISQTHNEELLSEYRDYFAAGLHPDLIAQNIVLAIETDESAVISEIIIRPNRQNK